MKKIIISCIIAALYCTSVQAETYITELELGKGFKIASMLYYPIVFIAKNDKCAVLQRGRLDTGSINVCKGEVWQIATSNSRKSIMTVTFDGNIIHVSFER